MSSIIDSIDDHSNHMHPLAFKASTDPDTMYMHEAMREPDKAEFVKAMEKEVQDQMNNNNFTIVHKDSVPKKCDHFTSSVANEKKARHKIPTSEEI